MSTPYYTDHLVTLLHGDALDGAARWVREEIVAGSGVGS